MTLAIAGSVLLIACATEPSSQIAAPSIHLTDAGQFELHDALLPVEGSFATLFPVSVERSTLPMFGSYAVQDGVLRFTPRFPLTPGVSYRAEWTDTMLSGVFSMPELDPGPKVEVVAVYPSGDVLPENLLRFYLHFSAPVAQGDVYEYVELVDQDGKVVELAFLELGEELWDRSGTRLTLLFDPGRIKHGLRPRLEEGPILVAGRQYSLRIDGAWPDLAGRPLVASYEKRFRAGPADIMQPAPQRWSVSSPRVGSVDPLEVRFPSVLDHALLQRMIVVVGPDGSAVGGEVESLEAETVWRFVPAAAWSRMSYRLQVDTELEDTVGNSVRSPFEVDVSSEVRQRIEQRFVELPVVVR